KADKAQPKFLDVIAAVLLALRIDWRLLVSLPGDALYRRVAKQIQHLRDVVDAHIVQRAARRMLLLHESRRTVAVHVGTTSPPKARRAGVVNLAQVSAVDQLFGRARFIPE